MARGRCSGQPAQNMATTHTVGQLGRAIWRPAFSALCAHPHPGAPGPGVSSLSRVGVEVGPPGPLTAGLQLLTLILALNLVSRTQTPVGSLLCVQIWPGLGQDDGPQRTVDVSEWELTAHLPGPTYAAPAAPSPSSGLAGGEGGLVVVTGPGERLGLSACRWAEMSGVSRGPCLPRGRSPEGDPWLHGARLHGSLWPARGAGSSGLASFLPPQAALFFSISSQSRSLESPGLSGWAAGEPEGGAATGRGLILLSGSTGPACPGWEADAGMLHPQLITCM